MKWKTPPLIKIYEALGTIPDRRIEVSGNTARVTSSTGGKVYAVHYDPTTGAIMSNDNASYWQGYLGYPAISYLFLREVLDYRPELAELVKGVKWKEINQKYKNNFEKTLQEVLSGLSSDQVLAISEYVSKIRRDIEVLEPTQLGPRQKPPLDE